jgi:hypothetical protein
MRVLAIFDALPEFVLETIVNGVRGGNARRAGDLVPECGIGWEICADLKKTPPQKLEQTVNTKFAAGNDTECRGR